METREFKGKSVQEAIKIGLEAMDLGIDEADIDVVNEGSAGIFGIGAKKAVIRIKPIDFNETSLGILKEDDDVLEETDAIAAKSSDRSNSGDNIDVGAKEIPEKSRRRSRKDETPVDPMVDSKEHVEHLTKYLDGLFEHMKLECEYSISQRGDTLYVDIKSEDSGRIIGHRGETLDAIQYLSRLAIHKTDLSYRSVVVQTENYREKREQTLKALAQRLGNKVERTNRKVVLEPMKPYERRIIHETLQDNPRLITTSEGIEPNRYVVILPK